MKHTNAQSKILNIPQKEDPDNNYQNPLGKPYLQLPKVF